MSDTPETDAWVREQNDKGYAVWEDAADFARKLERERDQMRGELAFAWKAKFKADDYIQTLKNAIRNMRDVRGRHHTEIATKRLFELLEQQKSQ